MTDNVDLQSVHSLVSKNISSYLDAKEITIVAS